MESERYFLYRVTTRGKTEFRYYKVKKELTDFDLCDVPNFHEGQEGCFIRKDAMFMGTVETDFSKKYHEAPQQPFIYEERQVISQIKEKKKVKHDWSEYPDFTAWSKKIENGEQGDDLFDWSLSMRDIDEKYNPIKRKGKGRFSSKNGIIPNPVVNKEESRISPTMSEFIANYKEISNDDYIERRIEAKQNEKG